MVRILVILVLAVGGGGLIALSPDIATASIVLMLPGLITLLIDSSPGLGLARAMLLFQAAACSHPVADAWFRCSGVHACLGYLSTPLTVAKTWTAAALAWVLSQAFPVLLKLLIDHKLRERQARLEERQKILLSEWVTEGDGVPAP